MLGGGLLEVYWSCIHRWLMVVFNIKLIQCVFIM